MTDRLGSDRGRVVIETDLPASVEEVYAAWTEPRAMGRWLSPTGHAEVEADVQVGGRLRVVMVGADMRIEHTGEYLAVEPPRRLSFTWNSPYTGDGPSIVTVTLTRREDSTRLRLVHERLPEVAAESHRDGWGTMIRRLATQVLAGPHQQPETMQAPSARKDSGAG